MLTARESVAFMLCIGPSLVSIRPVNDTCIVGFNRETIVKTKTSFQSMLRKGFFLSLLASGAVLGGCAQYTFETPQGPAFAYGPMPAQAPVYRVAPPPLYAAPRYVAPEREYRYEDAPAARVYAAPAAPCGPGLTPNRVLGGIAGGLLGSMIGGGNGRIAASAAGAVLGSSMGGC